MVVIERRLLAIYLNDHRAGATGGVELARRARSSNRGTRWSETLETVCVEIEADLTTLEQVMEHLGVKRSVAKIAAAWSAERVGRLKPNGRLRGYSPLSRMLELEMLHIGITGKMEMWRVLEATLASQLTQFDLPRLIERAESQRTTVERLRIEAAAETFAGEGAS
jgi:hypothetical protein